MSCSPGATYTFSAALPDKALPFLFSFYLMLANCLNLAAISLLSLMISFFGAVDATLFDANDSVIFDLPFLKMR